VFSGIQQGFTFSGAVATLLLNLYGALAQTADWEAQHTAGKQAFSEDRYVDAEKFYLSALTDAENFDEKDPRLATTVYDLGVLF
jgi:hypothetical protein